MLKRTDSEGHLTDNVFRCCAEVYGRDCVAPLRLIGGMKGAGPRITLKSGPRTLREYYGTKNGSIRNVWFLGAGLR
jgi:hypothetical protein